MTEFKSSLEVVKSAAREDSCCPNERPISAFFKAIQSFVPSKKKIE